MWVEYTLGPPNWLSAALMILGVLFSLFFHSRISRRKIPFLAAIILFMVVDILGQRSQPVSRSWIMLEPILYITLAAGLLAPLQWLDQSRPSRWSAAAIGLGILMTVMLAGNVIRASSVYINTAGDKGMGEVEKTTLYLKGQLTGSDIVVVAPPDDAPFWYYFRLHEIPGYYIYGVKVRSFSRVLVPINHLDDNNHDRMSVEKSIHDRGPDLGFINLDSDQIIQQVDGIDVHQLYPNQSALIKQYGK